MIDQTRSGKFVIVGMARVYKSLKEMVTVHKKVQASVRPCLCYMVYSRIQNIVMVENPRTEPADFFGRGVAK